MKTIAVLFPGDMGGALAKILVDDGHRVISYLADRSERTKQSAAAAGVHGVDSWLELATQSDLVVSLVPPSAVVPVAQAYAAAAKHALAPGVFVDANAKTTATARQVAEIVGAASCGFVNACVIGGANSLRQKGKFFVSGPDSSPFVDVIKHSVAVDDLGPELEKVSAFKLLFSGFNKTIAAAWFEVAIAANGFDLFEPLFTEIASRSPAVWNSQSNSFGTYARHLARRQEEMAELGEMLTAQGLPSGIADGAASTFQAILNAGALSPENAEEGGKEFLRQLKARR